MITKVKGTQDFIDTSLLNFITTQSIKHLKEYNFNQIETPIIEHTELFKRSLGLHTDVVSKEMFLISSKDEDSICLRPEVTAPAVRAFIENNIQQLPWKVFIIGPMFRYERPQKGRFRQFHQIDIEIIGTSSIMQDALLIKMLDELFKNKFKLNNYTLLLNFLGCYQDREKFNEVLKKFLDSVSDKICSNCIERKTKNPLRIYDCKVPTCIEIYKNAPSTTDYLCTHCKQEWDLLQNTIESISVPFKHSKTLVRGLDYYDKTVFEFSSTDLGAQNAFCGGGRYDRLVKEIDSNKDQPAVGAAIGIERLMLLLENKKDLPIAKQSDLNLILPLSPKQHTLALSLANALHSSSYAADILTANDSFNWTIDVLFEEDSSVKSLMRKANKMGAKFCLILGDEEESNKEVTVKNMITGEEKKIHQTNLIEYLKLCNFLDRLPKPEKK